MKTLLTGNQSRYLLWLERLCRYLLAAVFLAAGIPKLFAPNAFAEVIGMYGILPNVLVDPAAILLPVAEILTGAGLIFGKRWALLLAVAQMVLFVAVLAYGIHLGLDIDCGCFGPEDPEHAAVANLRTALARDIVLLMPLAYSWWFSRRFKQISTKGE